MSNYKSHSVHLTENQKTKLHRAVKKGSPVSLKLSHQHLHGSHPLPLTDTQIKHINKASMDGVGYVLNLSTPQVKHIVTGGFIPLLLGALGALATGALSGAASYGANKLLTRVAGNGFGESYIQNASAVGKGALVPSYSHKPINYHQPIPSTTYKKKVPKSKAMGQGLGFQGSGIFQYGQPPTRGSGMVPL